ncbi:uncharacterized protein LOC101238613 [Trichonephila clavipes]|nr:uncharacterized protein LOC101238613 [Trichonephila clavipes]
MARTWLYSCSDSSNAQPARSCGYEIPSPTSNINRVPLGTWSVVGAYRLFERSNARNVQYSEYYGDGDSKGYEAAKYFYGTNSVSKLECIRQVQKRVEVVASIKKTIKDLGGKTKLTDKLTKSRAIME